VRRRLYSAATCQKIYDQDYESNHEQQVNQAAADAAKQADQP
jgi:hypothetical protein